jgi:MGT family glycosyltransferase
MHPMSKFVFALWEGGGLMPPTLKVVSQLLAAKHDVRVISDACNQAEAEAAGARFSAWRTAPSRPDKFPQSDPIEDWLAPGPEGFRRILQGVMVGPAALYAADLLSELEREPCDLVVTSEILCGVMVACESVEQPVAVLTATVSLVPLAGMPPMGPGVAPAQNDEERAMQAGMAAYNVQLFDSGLPQLNQLRARLGLAPLHRLYDQWAAADAILLGTSPAFDFPADSLPANIRYVGPQLCGPAWAEAWQPAWPADDPRPLVLVSFSTTFQNHVEVLQRVIDALDRFSVRVVATLGPALASDAVRPAANTQVVSSAPHDQLMREAALVVTHGGHGTVINALAHGAPLLVIPHGRDQNDIAARVTAREAGLRLTASATTEEITAAVDLLLSDPRYRESAQRLGARIVEDARNSTVIRELEALAHLPRRAAAS